MAVIMRRVSNPNTKELLLVEDYILKSPGNMFKGWDIAPEFCICERLCQCGNFKRMSDDQLKQVELHVKEIRAERKRKIG